MAFNRDKWKPASLAANKDLGKKVEGLTKQFGSSERTDFHKIEEGVNVFRICPPHNQEDPSIEAKCTTWLPRKVDVLDKDNKPTGKKEIKDRPVFNSRVHGGTEKDIVDEYINFAYKLIYDETQDKDERTKKMSPISGWRGKDGKWNPGIKFSTSYIMYAFKGGKLGRLDLYKNDKDKMEELNISEDAEDPISTDIFSDPNEGVSLIITRKKDEKGKLENILSRRMYNHKKFATHDEFIESERLTDDQLMELEKQPSLKSLYRDCYKRSDFNLALEGLKIFDEKNEFNVFENDDFLKICEEIDAYYPETEEEGDDTEKALKSESFEDRLNKMNREELKSLIKQRGFDTIKVMKSWSEDDIREAILDVISKQSKSEEELEEEEEEETTEDKLPESEDLTEKEETSTSKKQDPKDLPWEKEEQSEKTISTADKLKAMKAKLGKK